MITIGLCAFAYSIRLRNADHGPVSREVDVIPVQVKVVADFVEGLAQHSLV
jgi:hypothetical protein